MIKRFLSETTKTMIDNIWWIFFSSIAGIGFFISLLLLTSPSKTRPGTKPLVFVMLLFSLTLVQFVILWTKTSTVFPHLHNLWQVFNFWYGPLLFCFFKGKIGLGFRKLWPHFVLGVVVFLMWLPYGFMSTATKVEYLQQGFPPLYSKSLPTNYLLYLTFWWVSASVQALYATYFLFRSYIRKETHDFKKLIANLFAIFVLARVIYFVCLNFEFFNPQWDYAISLTMSYCIFRIGLLAYHRPEYFFIERILAEAKVKYASTSISSEQSAVLAKQVTEHMKKNHAFLNPDLRLPGLANTLDAKPHHISQAINEHYKRSFSEWVNGFRIEHACALLSNAQLSAKEAGYQSGFNNLATFYKAFKKEKNMTPAKYRDQKITDHQLK